MLQELLGPNGLLLPTQPLGATSEARSQAPVPPQKMLRGGSNPPSLLLDCWSGISKPSWGSDHSQGRLSWPAW